jgi:hypothetical protein
LRPGVVLIALVVVGCACSVALADWKEFVPRPIKNGAYLDLFGSYEDDDNRNEVSPFHWNDTFFREKITIYSDGYVYDPRFLQYHVSLAGAIKQELYRATHIVSPGWTHSSGFEYDTKLLFLSEHPYNVELFALRYEPLYKEQAAVLHNSVQTSWGGAFRYRKRPWMAHATLNDNTNESGPTTSEVRRVGLGGEYSLQARNGNRVSFFGAYNPSDFTTNSGLEGIKSDYTLGNTIDLRHVRLDSNVTGGTSDQESSTSGTFQADQFSWYEILNLMLPLNFRSDLIYRQHRNETTIPGGAVLGDLNLKDKSKEVQFDIVHRLYQSLDTRYVFLNNNRTSSGGDTISRSNSLGLNYTKLIPWGRALAGINVARGRTDNEGHADVVNEPHLATPVPGSFMLDQPNADPGTISLLFKSPLPPFQTILLVENVHYTITVIGNTVQITLVTLPPAFVVPGTYDFYVSYSLSTGSFGLRSNSDLYNASVELWDQTLIPYASYGKIRSDVVSGVLPGIAPDVTTKTGGVLYHHGPLRLRGEYQSVDWQVSPYRSWRTELQYVASPSPTTHVYATGWYLNKYYLEGTSIQPGQPYTDETVSAAGSFQKQIPTRNLSFSAGGSLSRLQGPVDTNGYALNSSLTWKVGRMDLTTGMSAYTSSSSGVVGVDTSRVHQYYYFMIRRYLF